MSWEWRKILQKTLDDTDKEFFVASVWDAIRPRGTVIDWHNMVWFSHCIPRHAFNLWTQADSHNHLFLSCIFSFQVWDHVKIYDGVPTNVASLDSIVTHLIPIFRKRSARTVIAKLMFAASCYFIWQEKNYMLFKNQKRSQDQIIDVIKSNVRLKFLTCKFKRMNNVKALLHLWKLSDSLIQTS
ncbi:hypothetical protein Tco_0300034 [Tanacetum coccineum]